MRRWNLNPHKMITTLGLVITFMLLKLYISKLGASRMFVGELTIKATNKLNNNNNRLSVKYD